MNILKSAQVTAAGRIYERFENHPDRETWMRAWMGTVEVTATHDEPEALAAYLRTRLGDNEAMCLLIGKMMDAGVLMGGTVIELKRDSWADQPRVTVDAEARTVTYRIDLEITQDRDPFPSNAELRAGLAKMRRWVVDVDLLPKDQEPKPDRQLGLFDALG